MDAALMTLFPVFVVVIGVFAFASFAKNVQKARQNRTWTQSEPEQAQPAKAEQQPKPPAAQPDKGFMAFDSAHKTDKQGWDSYADFHEGEDPCHDDMQPLSTAEARPTEAAMPSDEAKELVRGFVIGEILSRKRR